MCSEATTFAINFWFRSPLHTVLQSDYAHFGPVPVSVPVPVPAMAPYVARTALLSLLSAELRAWQASWDNDSTRNVSGTPGGPSNKLTFSIQDFSLPQQEPVEGSCHEDEHQQRCRVIGRCFATASLAEMARYWTKFAMQVSLLCCVIFFLWDSVNVGVCRWLWCAGMSTI